MWKEFKAFAFKGNVLDLAIAVIIGAAFGKIVTSIVNDLLMPIIGLISGGVNLTNLEFHYSNAVVKYGSFLQNVVDFLIVSFSIFLFVKLINRFKHKEIEQPTAPPVPDTPPAPDAHILLLGEIRDLLKEQRTK